MKFKGVNVNRYIFLTFIRHLGGLHLEALYLNPGGTQVDEGELASMNFKGVHESRYIFLTVIRHLGGLHLEVLYLNPGG